MKIQTFRAHTLQEALRQARLELGPRASLVHIREIRPKKRFGGRGKKIIEIDASSDIVVPSRFSANTVVSQPGPSESPITSGHHAANADVSETKVPTASVETSASLDSPASQRTPQFAGQSDEQQIASQALYQRLLENNVDAKSASELIVSAEIQAKSQSGHDTFELSEVLLQDIANNLNTGGSLDLSSGHPQVMAFVGPSGVGKTSLVTKLAKLAHREHRANIGFITLDPSRHGAVEQLLYVAEQLSASLEVIGQTRQMASAQARLEDCDLILIDTPGRSFKDSQHMSGLRELLRAARPTHTCLVLNTCYSECCARQVIQAYSQLPATHLALSKLDEVAGFGSWYALLANCPLPISYISTGQAAPDDLITASPELLASYLAGAHLAQPLSRAA